MGSFDMLVLWILLLAAFVLIVGSAVQGFTLRSHLFVLPVFFGVISLVSSVGIIFIGPEATTMTWISSGYLLGLGVIFYVIFIRRLQSAAQKPPGPASPSDPPGSG